VSQVHNGGSVAEKHGRRRGPGRPDPDVPGLPRAVRLAELGCDSWWDELGYRRCSTFTLKGAFILTKLLQRDAAQLRTVLLDLYRTEKKDPQYITKFELETILRYMESSPEEIADVQARMGRQWR